MHSIFVAIDYLLASDYTRGSAYFQRNQMKASRAKMKTEKQIESRYQVIAFKVFTETYESV